jgi:hypothetical protein
VVALVQRLWRLRWCSDYGDRVGAAIAVMAASAQRLRRWRRWRSDCGGGVGCGSVGVGWRSDSGDSGVLAVVAAMALVVYSDCGGGVGAAIAAATALAQGLWQNKKKYSSVV